MLLDATHGTNRYNYKLACFTTVNSSGQTVILAATLLQTEDQDSYTWCLECFMEVFRKKPMAFFTDSDQALRQAFLTCSAEGGIFAGTHHFLYSRRNRLRFFRRLKYSVTTSTRGNELRKARRPHLRFISIYSPRVTTRVINKAFVLVRPLAVHGHGRRRLAPLVCTVVKEHSLPLRLNCRNVQFIQALHEGGSGIVWFGLASDSVAGERCEELACPGIGLSPPGVLAQAGCGVVLCDDKQCCK